MPVHRVGAVFLVMFLLMRVIATRASLRVAGTRRKLAGQMTQIQKLINNRPHDAIFFRLRRSVVWRRSLWPRKSVCKREARDKNENAVKRWASGM